MSTTTPSSAAPAASIDQIRAAFPSLDQPLAFMENAGGSQVPAVVADAIRDYMLSSYVQLGAGYELSQQADRNVEHAHAFINRFMNGEGTGHVILGPSCTQLMTMLADCYGRVLQPGDEIVVAQNGHEANIGPWTKLERFGLTIRTWPVDPDAMDCTLDGLEAVLSNRTRIVAIVHVSNLLGAVADLDPIVKRVHDAGARIVVDGVAYAPHRAIDVRVHDVDWYVYSTYKVYGPHMGALYGRQDAIDELEGPNHFFIPKDEVPYKFELGGASHEGCAGLLALQSYLAMLAAVSHDGGAGDLLDRAAIERAFDLMTSLELPLQQRILDALASRNEVRLIGPASAGPDRVPTISFVHDSLSSAEIARRLHQHGIACRNGHMYAYRLCEALGLDLADGVVRLSLVHYNTMDEVNRLVRSLDDVLSP